MATTVPPQKEAPPKTTDPAQELHDLAEWFARHQQRGTALQALSTLAELPADSPDFGDALSAVQRRIAELLEIAETAADADFTSAMRSNVLKAGRDLMAMVNFGALQSGWDQRKEFVSEKNRMALLFFSQTAKRYKQHRVISADERTAALSRLAQAKEDVSNDGELEGWEKSLLIQGLDRVALVVKHLQFFGHDAAISALLLAQQNCSIVAERHSDKSQRRGVAAALHAILLAAHLFFLPSEAVTALHHYRAWTAELTNAAVQMIEREAPRLALPAPEKVGLKPEAPQVEPPPTDAA